MPDPHTGLSPSTWVTRWAAGLPAGATVLDLACGSGRHVRWLAGQGLEVTAVDRDEAALAPLRSLPGVEVVVADLEGGPWPLTGRRFDAVVVTNYLWRALWPSLTGSFAPSGLLIYETFGSAQATIGKPSNPDFLLQPGELLARTAGLHTLAYEDGFIAHPARFVQRIAALAPPAEGTDAPALSAQVRRHPL